MVLLLFPELGLRLAQQLCHRFRFVSGNRPDTPPKRQSIIVGYVLGAVSLILAAFLVIKHFSLLIPCLFINCGAMFIIFPDVFIRCEQRIGCGLRILSRERLHSPIRKWSRILKRVQGLLLLILVKAVINLTQLPADSQLWNRLAQVDGPDFAEAVRGLVESEELLPDMPVTHSAKNLHIISAKFGASNQWIDVTKQIRDQIDDNTLEITVSNDIAGDPSYGGTRTLKLEYTLDGEFKTAAFRKGVTCRIPGDPFDELKTITTAERLIALAKACPAEVGFYGKNLTTGKTVEYQPDQPACLASIVKVFVLLEVMRQVDLGKIDLSMPILVKREGSEETCTVSEAVDKMIGTSDNDATTALAELVGYDEINTLPRNLGIVGLSDQILPRPGVLSEVLDKRVYGLRIPLKTDLLPQHGTAQGIVQFFELLYRNELLNKSVSQRVLTVFDKNPKYFAPRATPMHFISGGKGGGIGWVRPGHTPYNMGGWGILIRSEDMALAFCLWCEWFPAGMSREKQRKWYLGLSDCIVNILLQPSTVKTNGVQPIE